MSIRVERFSPERIADFRRVHSDENGAGWCRCAAWWVPTWEGWGDRTAQENRALRDAFCARGEYDGLLAYDRADPVGWCQLGPRDRLEKLVAQLELEPDPAVWAVTCFLVAPAARRRGVAAALLDAAVEEARTQGASRLEGYPRASAEDPREMWTGPAGLYLRAGFEEIHRSTPRSVFSRALR